MDMTADSGYTSLRNAIDELPRPLQILDRRIVSLPDAVRGKLAASISWMALFESRMTAFLPIRLARIPRMAAREDEMTGRVPRASGHRERHLRRLQRRHLCGPADKLGLRRRLPLHRHQPLVQHGVALPLQVLDPLGSTAPGARIDGYRQPA